VGENINPKSNTPPPPIVVCWAYVTKITLSVPVKEIFHFPLEILFKHDKKILVEECDDYK
jgi:hypothetical protein